MAVHQPYDLRPSTGHVGGEIMGRKANRARKRGALGHNRAGEIRREPHDICLTRNDPDVAGEFLHHQGLAVGGIATGAELDQSGEGCGLSRVIERSTRMDGKARVQIEAAQIKRSAIQRRSPMPSPAFAFEHQRR